MNKTSCLVGNSSSGIREGAYIGTPVVNIGTRQLNREKASNVISCAHQGVAIYNSIMYQVSHKKYPKSSIYGNGTAAKKIVKILNRIKVNIQKNITY
jgi:UDP-N-acetylglucosamine 2-epimerase